MRIRSGGRRIAVVVGTRPEIVKMAPVIREIERLFGPGAALVVNTGQHYDESMSGQVWSELALPAPTVRLDAGGRTRADCIGYLCTELGRVFGDVRPAAVLVQGDTNTTMAGALAANAESIPLVHVEAGLRSHDRAMPEEHNRVVVDQLADLCCAATPANRRNLLDEGIPAHRVVLTGSTIVEAVHSQLPSSAHRERTLDEHSVVSGRYLLATIHRPENTDDPTRLRTILASLATVSDESGMPVVFPVHPRTRAAAKKSDCEDLLTRLGPSEPIGVWAFLALAMHAAVLVSDSGGIAEEVTVLKRPLVVVRRSTERRESVEAGFARMVAPEGITAAVRGMLDGLRALLLRLEHTDSPYGDGRASVRIVSATRDLIVAPTVETSYRMTRRNERLPDQARVIGR